MKKIVTCASYGGTGSSVITDLLKEFNNVKSTGDFEVSIAHEYGGISDLEHYLVEDFHRMKNDEAIYAFKKLIKAIEKDYNKFFDNEFNKITQQYLNEIIKETWQGYWHQHPNRVHGIEKIIKYKFPMLLERVKHKFIKNKHDYEFVPKQRKDTMYLSINNQDFYVSTKKYFENLFTILDKNNQYEYIAIDQLVPPTNISRYQKYFNNIKVIVVDRDPRDLYLLNKLYWKEGWIPTDSIDVYINWFKSIRKNDFEEKDVLRINFEDFISNYDQVIEEIMEFLDLKKINHVQKLKYFNPEKSKKNYKLYEKEEILTPELKNDLQKIENRLSEFIIL